MKWLYDWIDSDKTVANKKVSLGRTAKLFVAILLLCALPAIPLALVQLGIGSARQQKEAADERRRLDELNRKLTEHPEEVGDATRRLMGLPPKPKPTFSGPESTKGSRTSPNVPLSEGKIAPMD